MTGPRIVDVIFARQDPAEWRRAGIAWGTTALFGVALMVGVRFTRGPDCECGVRVPPAPTLFAVDIPRPPEPPKPEQKTEPPPEKTPTEAAPARAAAATAPTPPSFAQAAQIIARETSPNEPVDLTGQAFVTGSGTTYSGGMTTSAGTSSAAVRTAPAPVQSARAPVAAPLPRPEDLSRPVNLPDPSWTCPWPAGAESEALDEQSAFVQVTVRADGTVERAVVMMDPGMGFGEAARRCAASARFSPALDKRGVAVRAISPPIRVRFVR